MEGQHWDAEKKGGAGFEARNQKVLPLRSPHCWLFRKPSNLWKHGAHRFPHPVDWLRGTTCSRVTSQSQ